MPASNTISPDTTGQLISELFDTDDISDFLRQHNFDAVMPAFADYIVGLCERRGVVISQLMIDADVSLSFGYAIFNGTRMPSRDTVIKLAIALELDLDETQKLLAAASRGRLYPKIRRDAVVIHAILHSVGLAETQRQLRENGLDELGAKKNDAD